MTMTTTSQNDDNTHTQTQHLVVFSEDGCDFLLFVASLPQLFPPFGKIDISISVFVGDVDCGLDVHYLLPLLTCKDPCGVNDVKIEI